MHKNFKLMKYTVQIITKHSIHWRNYSHEMQTSEHLQCLQDGSAKTNW